MAHTYNVLISFSALIVLFRSDELKIFKCVHLFHCIPNHIMVEHQTLYR